MAAPTYVQLPANRTRVAAKFESVENTYDIASGTRLVHQGGRFTRNHQPIDGSQHGGAIEPVLVDRAVPGPEDPEVSLTWAWRHDNLPTILQWIAGGAVAANAWPLQYQTSCSLGIDDGTREHQFAGCFLDTAEIRSEMGSIVTVDTRHLATSYAEASNGSFPTLVPSQTNRPYRLLDLSLKIGTTAAAAAAATAIPLAGCTISVARNLVVEHNNSRFPNAIRDGQIDVTGSLSFPWSAELYTAFGGIATGASYTKYFAQIRWTIGSLWVQMLTCCAFNIDGWDIPAGKAQRVGTTIGFSCGASAADLADSGTTNTMEWSRSGA